MLVVVHRTQFYENSGAHKRRDSHGVILRMGKREHHVRGADVREQRLPLGVEADQRLVP